MGRDLDALAAAGLCLGSGMPLRAWDLPAGEGVCPHCSRYVALDGAVVAEHRGQA